VVERARAQYVYVGLPVLSNVLCWATCVRPARSARSNVHSFSIVSIYTCTAGRAGRTQGAQHYTLLNTGNPSKIDAHMHIFLMIINSLRSNGWAACGPIRATGSSIRSEICLSLLGFSRANAQKNFMGMT